MRAGWTVAAVAATAAALAIGSAVLGAGGLERGAAATELADRIVPGGQGPGAPR